MSNWTKAKFISNNASGNDKFESGSHTKIADNISNIIENVPLARNVIGLEGSWGSGKSNVVKLIQRKLSNSHHTVIFDAWANQEDLTRKTFLEETIDSIEAAEKKPENWNSEDWKNELLQLDAKTSTKKTEFFPTIKVYWVYAFLSFSLFTILKSIYDLVFKDWDMITSVDLQPLKPILFICLLPFILLCVAIFHLNKDWKSIKQKNNSPENKNPKLSKNELRGRLFYWLKGENLEAREDEFIIEQEPTSRQFRIFFKKILNSLGDRKLIVVFDNIDRLDQAKVAKLWSSIHTFFAEDKPFPNTWVIIPYSKSELFLSNNKENGNKDFIEKSFFITIPVSPPLVSNWELFLREITVEAFSEDRLKKETIDFIIRLFDIHNSTQQIRPRKLIWFVNRMVALDHQWNSTKEIIDLKYIALFALKSDNLTSLERSNESVFDSIVSAKYLGDCDQLFSPSEDLIKVISMLYYNVDKKYANEVLFKPGIENSLKSGNFEFVESSKDHSAFPKFFSEACNKLSGAQLKEHFLDCVPLVKDSVTTQIITNTRNKIGEHIIEKLGENFALNKYHRRLLPDLDKHLQKKFYSKASEALDSNLGTDNEALLINGLVDLRRFHEEETNAIQVKESDYLTERKVSPKSILTLAKKVNQDYETYRLSTDEAELNQYFIDVSSLRIEILQQELKNLIHLKNSYDLSEIVDALISEISSKNMNELDEIAERLKILNSLSEDLSRVQLSDHVYTNLRNHRTSSHFLELIVIGILNYTHTQSIANFNVALQSDFSSEETEKLYELIFKYMDGESLFQLIVDHSSLLQSTLIKEVAQKILVEKRLEVPATWLIENFEQIESSILTDDIYLRSYLSSNKDNQINVDLDEIHYQLLRQIEATDKLFLDLKKYLFEKAQDLGQDDLLLGFESDDWQREILMFMFKHKTETDHIPDYRSSLDKTIKHLANSEVETKNVNSQEINNAISHLKMVDQKELIKSNYLNSLDRNEQRISSENLQFLNSILFGFNLWSTIDDGDKNLVVFTTIRDGDFENSFGNHIDEFLEHIRISEPKILGNYRDEIRPLLRAIDSSMAEKIKKSLNIRFSRK